MIQRNVAERSKQIQMASREGRTKEMRNLQGKLTRTLAAKLWAVFRITTNKGKNTAGVDGVKTLTDQQKLHLAKTLKIGTKAQAVRRV